MCKQSTLSLKVNKHCTTRPSYNLVKTYVVKYRKWRLRVILRLELFATIFGIKYLQLTIVCIYRKLLILHRNGSAGNFMFSQGRVTNTLFLIDCHNLQSRSYGYYFRIMKRLSSMPKNSNLNPSIFHKY